MFSVTHTYGYSILKAMSNSKYEINKYKKCILLDVFSPCIRNVTGNKNKKCNFSFRVIKNDNNYTPEWKFYSTVFNWLITLFSIPVWFQEANHFPNRPKFMSRIYHFLHAWLQEDMTLDRLYLGLVGFSKMGSGEENLCRNIFF